MLGTVPILKEHNVIRKEVMGTKHYDIVSQGGELRDDIVYRLQTQH